MKNEIKNAAIGLFSLGMFIMAISVFAGCGSTQYVEGPQGTSGEQGLSGSNGSNYIPPVSTDAQTLVQEENDYRSTLGQAILSPGLSCSVILLDSGQWLSSSSPGYNSGQGVVHSPSGSTTYAYLFKSTFNQDNSSGSTPNTLLPLPLQPLFVNTNYRLTCSGQLVVSDTGYYYFSVNSDDGSILTIDGSQVVNNDGNHGMTEKTGTKLLRRGVHIFNFQYAQTGSGNFGLMLKMNNDFVSSNLWYH